MPNYYAVIMAGGAGTRFWPASRNLRPKQLLPLGNDPKEPLLAATVRRIEPLIPADRVYIATGRHLLDATCEILPRVPRANVLAEPIPRNTAPCIAWAAQTIARRDPEAIIAVFPSDHTIAADETFRAVVARSLAAAAGDAIVTIGIVPERPETGYGYIELGSEVSSGVRQVKRFIEKPTREVAEQLVAAGNNAWNAGMFFFRASTLMRAVRKHLPELALGLDAIDAAALRGEEPAELERTFPKLPSISIDKGVMEKEERILVAPGNFGWNDVGSWQATWELAPKDERGNAAPSGTVLVDATGNLVKSLTTGGHSRTIALVGVSDLVVVETDDALLVIPRERAQDVRAVVDELKRRGTTGTL